MIDLDEAREARKREGSGEPVEVKIEGQVFALPAELPFETVDLMATTFSNLSGAKMGDAIKAMLMSLFGDEQYEAFVALEPSLDDVMQMVESLMETYGMKPGESVASPES